MKPSLDYNGILSIRGAAAGLFDSTSRLRISWSTAALPGGATLGFGVTGGVVSDEDLGAPPCTPCGRTSTAASLASTSASLSSKTDADSRVQLGDLRFLRGNTAAAAEYHEQNQRG